METTCPPNTVKCDTAPLTDILGCFEVIKGIVCLEPVHQAVRRRKDHIDIRQDNQGEKHDSKKMTIVLFQKPLQKLLIETL
jgi:hypothetical protein